MKKPQQLLGYTLRRGAIATTATGFGLLWKQLWPDLLSASALTIAVGVAIMIVVTVMGLVGIDLLLDKLYRASYSVRRWLALLDRSFIEGAWVDVGLVGSGDARRAVNFSFITISYDNGQHRVHGLSWLASNELSLTRWSSEFSSWEDGRLTFWFNEDTGPARQIASRAVYRVTAWSRRMPSGIEGAYREPNQDVDTRSMRVDPAFLADFIANNTPAGGASLQAQHGNDLGVKALGTAATSALVAQQLDLRRQLAKWHLRRIAGEENLDPPHWTARNRIRFSKDYADWYGAFLEASDQKAAEFSLLASFLDERLASGKIGRGIRSILDIGPGNGKLSSAVVDKLKTRFQKIRYTAIEPSLALGGSLQDELCGKHPEVDFRLISQRWSSYIEWQDTPPYDLALAFHSLYFCDKPLEEISLLMRWVKSGQLDQGAILFHTDWEESPVLRGLGAAASGSRLCDVLGMTKQAAADHQLDADADRSGELLVHFPTLSNAQWTQLLEASNLAADDKVRTVARLLAFLINMAPNDDGSWEAAGQVLRDALAKSPTLRLPLRIQHFRKP